MRQALKGITLAVVAMAALGLGALPAQASRVDTTSGTFGTAVGGPLVSVFASGGNSSFVTVTSQVYVSGGVFTYVYTLSGYNPAPSTSTLPILNFSIASSLFSSGLSWGVVTDLTSGAVGLDSPDVTTFGASSIYCGTAASGFFPCTPSLNYFLSNGTGTGGGLHAGETLAVYAQSTLGPGIPPTTSASVAIDTDWGQGSVIAPAVPEPGTMALFGSGLLGMAFAVRRKFHI